MANFNAKIFDDMSDDELDEYLTNEKNWEVWRDAGEWGWSVYRRAPDRFEPHLRDRVNVWNLKGFNEKWLNLAEEHDHVQLYRTLKQKYYLEKRGGDWRKAHDLWEKDVLVEIETSTNLEHDLQKWRIWWEVPYAIWTKMYELFPEASLPLLTRHFESRLFRGDEYPQTLADLAKERGDTDLFFAMYRKLTSGEQWQKDMIALSDSIQDDGELLRELRLRMIEGEVWEWSPLSALAEHAGKRVAPFIAIAVNEMGQSWDSRTWNKLYDLADEWEEVPLQELLARKRVDVTKFNKILENAIAANDIVRLLNLRGATSFGGFTTVHEKTARQMYALSPELTRSYMTHFHPGNYNERTFYSSLTKEAVKAGDVVFVDMLAARVAEHHSYWSDTKGYATFLKIYETLDDAEFIPRAVRVMTLVPSFNTGQKANPFFQFLLSDPGRFVGADVTPLLEAENQFVRGLAAKVLTIPSERQQAAAQIPRLGPLLLTRTSRDVIMSVVTALENAAHVDGSAELAANWLRVSLQLEQRNFPRDRVIAGLGRILASRPELQRPSEQPSSLGGEHDFCCIEIFW